MEPVRSGRSTEQNQLRADLKAGRLMKQALHQARLAYQFNPNTFSYECLSAVHRLHQRLRTLRLTAGDDADRGSSPSSQQGLK
jgi:hypothetical protein